MKKKLLCLALSFCLLGTNCLPALVKGRESVFQDVSADSPFFEAILWAVENGITNGTSPTTFSPSSPCKRKHIITFIWRGCGRPNRKTWSYPYEADKSLNADSDFGQAATGAYFSDIESGELSFGKPIQHYFNGETECSRGQAVIYLWKLAGRPNANLSIIRQFTDVNTNVDSDEAYTRELPKAVAWAVENGITNGTSKTTFSPATNCSRGNIVTFLYRFSKTTAGQTVLQ